MQKVYFILSLSKVTGSLRLRQKKSLFFADVRSETPALRQVTLLQTWHVQREVGGLNYREIEP